MSVRLDARDRLPRRVVSAGIAAMAGAEQIARAVRRFGVEGARALGHAPLRGEELEGLLLSVPYRDRDVFVDELLGFAAPPPDVADLPRGAVPYLPCGVEEILAMGREAPLAPHDELVDLGSGVGRVVILAHLLSGARSRGVEIQRPLVDLAELRAAELGLTGVSFVHADAAEVALDGTVFFLYAPFNGDMLTRVLRRLEDVARRRRIKVCTVGLELRDVPWLRSRPSACVSLSLYDSLPLSGRQRGRS